MLISVTDHVEGAMNFAQTKHKNHVDPPAIRDQVHPQARVDMEREWSADPAMVVHSRIQIAIARMGVVIHCLVQTTVPDPVMAILRSLRSVKSGEEVWAVAVETETMYHHWSNLAHADISSQLAIARMGLVIQCLVQTTVPDPVMAILRSLRSVKSGEEVWAVVVETETMYHHWSNLVHADISSQIAIAKMGVVCHSQVV